MPMIPLIMAAAGLLKAETVDKQKEERDRTLAANTQRWAPWTGLKANPIKEADPFGSALQYGGLGLSVQQGMNADTQNQAMNAAKMKYLNSMGGNNGAAPVAAAPDYSGNSSTMSPWDLSKYSAGGQ